jgi:hypothetical protein
MTLTRKASTSKKDKGKHICDDDSLADKKDTVISANSLATLDIFAGCGGLSEGMKRAGTIFLSAYFFKMHVHVVRYNILASPHTF